MVAVAESKNLFPVADEIPPTYRLEPLWQRSFLLAGELRQWLGPCEEVFSPICIERAGVLQPELIGSYPLLTEVEAQEALAAARKAYGDGRGPWPTMSVEQRIACVENFVVAMQARREEVVKLLMWEIAKSKEDSYQEFDRTVEYIRSTIEALKDLDRAASRFTMAAGIMAQIRRAPLGVTLCMGPSNYPLNETFTTLIPALIMGNTVIFKPPKVGVLLHEPLLAAFRDAFPPGVVNSVYGEGAVIIPPLMQSGQIACLAFIGSSRVADIIRSQHPKPHRLRCVLGLEAKNPAIILPDADLALAVKETALGALSFNGQRCTALKIIFVHSSLAERYLEQLAAEIDQWKIGLPWHDQVKLTPVAADRLDYFRELTADAQAQGARIYNQSGGSVQATFFHPAVLYPVTAKMRLYHEEQFGPVVAVAPFSDISEPVEYIIKSDYGQQASIFGRDPQQIADLIDPLVNQVCRLNINSQCQRGPDIFPFTGRKDSAEGTLSVSDALRVFSIRTLVAAKQNQVNKEIINDILRQRRSNFLSDDFIL